ncbi:MAG: hypothetical protein IT428_22670 [Planctomycetaceae bacterium]|nr:hypothetical protein [Planctomycetaceae bacterium]
MLEPLARGAANQLDATVHVLKHRLSFEIHPTEIVLAVWIAFFGHAPTAREIGRLACLCADLTVGWEEPLRPFQRGGCGFRLSAPFPG